MAITIIGRQWNADSEKLKTSVGLPKANSGRTEGDFLKPAAVRSMEQILAPNLKFSFAAPPASFTHEGYGGEYNEIKRPYNVPLVDVLGAKARKASFEFAIVQSIETPFTSMQAPGAQDPKGYDDKGVPRSNSPLSKTVYSPQVPVTTKILTYDNFWWDVEDQIARLAVMADMATPVAFTNFHDSLTSSYWYIDNITFTHTRSNILGKTVSASCNVSLIEYIPQNKKFILLPRIAYKKYTSTGKAKKVKEGTAVSDPDAWLSDITKREAEEAALAAAKLASYMGPVVRK
jgi:hypothetical protein